MRWIPQKERMALHIPRVPLVRDIRGVLFSLMVVGLAACGGPKPAQNPAPAEAGARPPAPARPETAGRLKRYSEIITTRAKTDSGLFHVHTVGDRLYYEIPDSMLGREMLLMTSIAGAPAGLSGFLTAGSVISEQVLRWERRGDRIVLRKLSCTESCWPCGITIPELKAGVWTELEGRGTVDAYRRNLQRAYIERLEFLLTEEPSVGAPNPSVWRTPVDVSWIRGGRNQRQFIRALYFRP